MFFQRFLVEILTFILYTKLFSYSKHHSVKYQELQPYHNVPFNFLTLKIYAKTQQNSYLKLNAKNFFISSYLTKFVLNLVYIKLFFVFLPSFYFCLFIIRKMKSHYFKVYDKIYSNGFTFIIFYYKAIREM